MKGGISMSKLHIADIDFPLFYAEVFPSFDAAKTFYKQPEDLPPEKNAGKIVFHQAARMVWLADQIDEVARGRPAFQVMFYMIAAELVAKITFHFEGEGESRKYVRRFFAEICCDAARARLAKSFSRTRSGPLSSQDAVDLLYNIRCDVAHEGKYSSFHLPLRGDAFAQLTVVGDESFVAHLTIQELRRMILEGAVLASQKLMNEAGTADRAAAVARP
jgi:hypothetical protein